MTQTNATTPANSILNTTECVHCHATYVRYNGGPCPVRPGYNHQDQDSVDYVRDQQKRDADFKARAAWLLALKADDRLAIAWTGGHRRTYTAARVTRRTASSIFVRTLATTGSEGDEIRYNLDGTQHGSRSGYYFDRYLLATMETMNADQVERDTELATDRAKEELTKAMKHAKLPALLAAIAAISAK